jgi:hypothetical protein
LPEAGWIFQVAERREPCRQTRLALLSCASARLAQTESGCRRAASANRANVSTDRRFIRNSAERGIYRAEKAAWPPPKQAEAEAMKCRAVLFGVSRCQGVICLPLSAQGGQ